MSAVVSILILLKCWLTHLILILQKFSQIPITCTIYILVIQHTVKERGRDYSSKRSFVFLRSGFFLIGRKMGFLLGAILFLIHLQFLKFTYSRGNISRGLQICLTDAKHICYNLFLRRLQDERITSKF